MFVRVKKGSPDEAIKKAVKYLDGEIKKFGKNFESKSKTQMRSLDFEKNIGMGAYFTEEEGIGGKLRTIPEDFVVKEIHLSWINEFTISCTVRTPGVNLRINLLI